MSVRGFSRSKKLFFDFNLIWTFNVVSELSKRGQVAWGEQPLCMLVLDDDSAQSHGAIGRWKNPSRVAGECGGKILIASCQMVIKE
jgi:hypothetical protein